jgi:preprotein translocase subunit SecE
MVEKVKQFLREVAVELRKVSWPTRKETVNLTVAVIILMLLLGVFLAVVDTGLAKLVALVIG